VNGDTTPCIFNLSIRWSEYSASHSNYFTSEERDPQYSLNRRVGGPQIQSGLCGEAKNISYSCWECNPDCMVVQHTA
jgi:hypothetical protein